MLLRYDRSDAPEPGSNPTTWFIFSESDDKKNSVTIYYYVGCRLGFGRGVCERKLLAVRSLNHVWRRVFWRFYWRID